MSPTRLRFIGDMFTIGLSGRLFIQNYPAMMQEYDRISVHNAWLQYRRHTGEAIGDAKPFAAMWAKGGIDPNRVPMVMQMRKLWHKMLWNQIERFGIEVSFGKRVVQYSEDPERGVASVTTDKGERAEADVVLAVDGLNSSSQDIVMPNGNKSLRSGRSVFRCAYPLELAMADPLVKEYFGPWDGKFPIVQTWLGPDTHLVALCYFDKEGGDRQMVWGITVHEKGSQSTKESWHQTVSSEDVLRILEETPGWGEPLKAMVKATPPDHIVYWPLIFRNPQPCWHSPAGRIIQIGDAAHSFLPTSGNGATQAIEDAVTIAECLKQAGSKANIPTAVKTHNSLRFDRVSCAQRLGWENAERFHKTDFSKGPIDVTKVQARVPKWIFTHDPEQYAVDNYAKAAASVAGGTTFENTNIPPGHVPSVWTMEEVLALEVEGKKIELSGDWS
jgi:2-polyprenyl-6-methoxyphenol hydroxylase-like FAD-dependent oxidoreductase